MHRCICCFSLCRSVFAVELPLRLRHSCQTRNRIRNDNFFGYSGKPGYTINFECLILNFELFILFLRPETKYLRPVFYALTHLRTNALTV